MTIGLLTQLFAKLGGSALAGLGGLVQSGQQQTAGDASLKSDAALTQQKFASILASLTGGLGPNGLPANGTADATASTGTPQAVAVSPLGTVILPQTSATQSALPDGKAMLTALDTLAKRLGAMTKDGAPDMATLATMLGVTLQQMTAFKASLEGLAPGTVQTGNADAPASPETVADTGDESEDRAGSDALAAALIPFLMVMSALPTAAEQVTPATANDLAATINASRTAPDSAAPAAGEHPQNKIDEPLTTDSKMAEPQMADPKVNGTTPPSATPGEQLAAALINATVTAAASTTAAATETPAALPRLPNMTSADKSPTPEATPSSAANNMAAQTQAQSNTSAERQIDTRADRKERLRGAEDAGKSTGTKSSGKTTETHAAAKGRDDQTVTPAATSKRQTTNAATELALHLQQAFATDGGPGEMTDATDGLGSLRGAGLADLSTGMSALKTSTSSPNWAPFSAYVAGQVGLQISRAIKDGNDNFKIRLDPPELGRVDVKLEIASDGRINAVLAADNEKTLQLLQKEQGALERALQDAGLKTDSGSLNFSLNSHQQNGRDGNDDKAFATSGRGRVRNSMSVDADLPAAATMRLTLSDRALDIRV